MSPTKPISIACIIPAYNEAPRIARVLDAVVGHPDIHEIIVVDDGSVDETDTIVAHYPSVRYIKHPKNTGKSSAVYTGITATTSNYILFIDADLVGLTPEAITKLIYPVKSGYADVSISLRNNTPKLWQKLGLDYISGERVIPKKIFLDDTAGITSIPSFGWEVFTNRRLIQKKCSIAIVSWNTVSSPLKEEKYGFLRGLTGDIGMIVDIFKTISFYEPIYQIYKMKKLMQLSKKKSGIPRISLVIPAYNEANYIAECLEHVLQNGRGFFHEIVVVDNASTDDTALIASRFPGVRVVQENTKGLTHARQCGYEAATGDILAYIDADTHMPEGWVERIVTSFKKDKDLVCLSGPYVYYDSPAVQKFLVAIYWNILAVPVYHMTGYMVVGGNFAIRKDTLDKMRGFDTTISFYGEDTNIGRRASEFGKVKFSSRFKMYTSARRLKGQGVFKTARIYMANFISEVVRRRPATSDYNDIR